MLIATRTPGPPLDAFVELFWLYEANAPHAAERLLPTGSMELVVVLSGKESLIAGPYSRFNTLDTSKPELVLGAHFRPGGAYAFLPMPAGELHNREVSLEDLWGANAARVLHDRLASAATPELTFDVLERALMERASTLERTSMIAWAVRELRRAPVARVTRAIGMSNRGFIDAFRRETGYTPKVYARVQRFQRVLRLVHGMATVDWADVALACGYYDQPHLIRDFRAFSGLSPSDYLARRTDHLNHVPM